MTRLILSIAAVLAAGAVSSAGGQEAANREVVLRVEQRLQSLGYPITPDGRYDADLRNNVMRYQSEHGLRPTGDVDLSTIGSLGIVLRPVEPETARMPAGRADPQ